MNTEAKKFNSEQVAFLDLLLKVDESEREEHNINLYYSFMQKRSATDKRFHMDWVNCSQSYDCIPSNFESDANIYFGVNLANAVTQYGRNTKEVIARVAALYAEFDGKDFVDVASDQYKEMVETHYNQDVALRREAGKNIGTSAYKGMRAKAEGEARESIFMANRQHYLDLLLPKIVENTKDLPPSLIVFSGGGYHCYWLLDNAKYLLTPEDRAACIEAQGNFVLAVGGDDDARDIARILRVLGTTNTKYEDNNIVSYVKEDVGLRYSFEQLAAFANNSASTTSRAKKSSGAKNHTKPNFMHGMPNVEKDTNGKFSTIPDATMAELHELYPSPLDVFRYLGLFTFDDELEDEGDEWRIPGYGGLLVAKEGGAWRCHGEDYGGDIVYAWLWASIGMTLPRKGDNWSLEDNKLWAKTVRRMLKEKGVDLDYDYKIFLTDEETAKTIKDFFDSENPWRDFEDYQDICEKVTTYCVKKYSRNEEAKLKLGAEFPIYRLSEMRNYDIHKDEVIEQIAYRGLVSLLFAKPNTGKSYLAIEIATSLMLGKKLLEQLNTRSRSSCVLYIAAETDADFKNRTVRAAMKFNANEGTLDNLLTYFDGDAMKFRLDDLDWINRFAASYLHRFEEDALPDLVIIDTLRTATNGGNLKENDNMEMSKVIGNTKRLCKALGNAACILIHHTHRTRGKNQDADFAGAGSLEGDCHIVLSAKKIDDTMNIYARKNKLVKTDSKKSILGIKFASTPDGAVLEPTDKSHDNNKGENDDINDVQFRMLKVIYDECTAGTPPIYKTFSDLLVARYNAKKDDTWINRKKELGIDPLAAGGYITFSGPLKDKTTVILITDKGKAYIESSKIREEDLNDEADDDDEED